jgi:hypothetical protein
MYNKNMAFRQKVFLFVTFSLLLVIIGPSPSLASCVAPPMCTGSSGVSLPCCTNTGKAISCSYNKNYNTPTQCCDLDTECPSTTHAVSSSSWGDPDGVSPFCHAQPGMIRTAIGCIPASDPKALINQVVVWSVSLAGGLSLATLIYAGFIMTTAGGDVKRVKEAQDSISSTLLGLAFIVLATVILNFLGVRILQMTSMGFGV